MMMSHEEDSYVSIRQTKTGFWVFCYYFLPFKTLRKIQRCFTVLRFMLLYFYAADNLLPKTLRPKYMF